MHFQILVDSRKLPFKCCTIIYQFTTVSLCIHLPNIDIITLEFASQIGKKQHLIFILLFISLIAGGIESLFAVY